MRALSKRHPRSGFPGVCATWTGVTERGHDGTARRFGGAFEHLQVHRLAIADGAEEVKCLFAFFTTRLHYTLTSTHLHYLAHPQSNYRLQN